MGETPPPQYSPYLRPGYTDLNRRPPGVYFEALGESWGILSSHFGLWTLTTLVAVILSVLAAIPSASLAAGLLPSTDDFLSVSGQLRWTVWMMVVVFLPQTLLTAAFSMQSYLAVRHLRTGEVTFADLGPAFSRSLPLAVISALTCIAVNVGSIIVVPGFYFYAAWIFAGIVCIDQKVGPFEALRISYRAVRSHIWLFVLLSLVLGIVAAAGILFCLVGLFLSVPITAIVVGIHYHYFFPPESNVIPPPVQS